MKTLDIRLTWILRTSSAGILIILTAVWHLTS